MYSWHIHQNLTLCNKCCQLAFLLLLLPRLWLPQEMLGLCLALPIVFHETVEVTVLFVIDNVVTFELCVWLPYNLSHINATSNHRLQDLCCLRLHSWCPAAVRKSIKMVGLVEAKSNFTKDETVGGRPMTVDLIGRWTMNIASKSWVTEPIITC